MHAGNGEKKRLSSCLLYCFLYLLSKLYFSIIIWNPLRKKKKLSCPVISVGNIVLGGTGKTPFVEMLAHMLKDRGRKPAVLSRGYGRKPTKTTAAFGVVSDGKKILIGQEESGDEPHLLAKNLPGVVVIVGKNRFLTGNIAIRKYGCDMVILDDGYQYWSLYRNPDIVLINARCPFGNGHLMPRGSLREPKSSLKRASLFLLTHTDESPDIQALRKELKSINPDTPIIEGTHSAMHLENIATGKTFGLTFLAGKDVFALSSIGCPESFEKQLKGLGANIKASLHFPDHHRYSSTDLNKVLLLSQKEETEMIVTTQKDAMRLEKISGKTDIFVLVIEFKIIRGKVTLEKTLNWT